MPPKTYPKKLYNEVYPDEYEETRSSLNYGPFSTQPARSEQPARERNYQDWSAQAEELWKSKPIEETERYYINLCSYIKNLAAESERDSTKLKPYALIKKKKLWRNGLRAILAAHPVTGKHYNMTMTRQAKAKTLIYNAGTSESSELSRSTQSSVAAVGKGLGRTVQDEAKEALQESRTRRAQQVSQAAIPPSPAPPSDLTCDEVVEPEPLFTINEDEESQAQ